MNFLSFDALDKIDTNQLRVLHDQIHKVWRVDKSELVWNYHKLIVQILKDRGVTHTNVDSLDSNLLALGDFAELSIPTLSLSELIAAHKLVHYHWNNQSDVPRKLTALHDATVEAMRNLGEVHSSQLYAPVSSSGNKAGQVVKLSDVLDNLKDINLSEPHIFLTGGLANNGETEGDIDVLINTSLEVGDPQLTPTKFRLYRSFPEELRGRIHFLTASKHPPFTSHVGIYRLKLERMTPFTRVNMTIVDEQLLKDFEN